MIDLDQKIEIAIDEVTNQLVANQLSVYNDAGVTFTPKTNLTFRTQVVILNLNSAEVHDLMLLNVLLDGVYRDYGDVEMCGFKVSDWKHDISKMVGKIEHRKNVESLRVKLKKLKQIRSESKRRESEFEDIMK